MLDIVTGGLGEHEETAAEDESPQELDGNGDAVRARVRAVLGTVVDARSEKQTDGDAELVARDESTTDLARS